MGYYQKLEWDDNATDTERFKAIFNVLNFVSKEMSSNDKIEFIF